MAFLFTKWLYVNKNARSGRIQVLNTVLPRNSSSFLLSPCVIVEAEACVLAADFQKNCVLAEVPQTLCIPHEVIHPARSVSTPRPRPPSGEFTWKTSKERHHKSLLIRYPDDPEPAPCLMSGCSRCARGFPPDVWALYLISAAEPLHPTHGT